MAIKKNVRSLKKVYRFDHIEGCAHWSELLEAGKEKPHQKTVHKNHPCDRKVKIPDNVILYQGIVPSSA